MYKVNNLHFRFINSNATGKLTSLSHNKFKCTSYPTGKAKLYQNKQKTIRTTQHCRLARVT